MCGERGTCVVREGERDVCGERGTCVVREGHVW